MPAFQLVSRGRNSFKYVMLFMVHYAQLRLRSNLILLGNLNHIHRMLSYTATSLLSECKASLLALMLSGCLLEWPHVAGGNMSTNGRGRGLSTRLRATAALDLRIKHKASSTYREVMFLPPSQSVQSNNILGYLPLGLPLPLQTQTQYTTIATISLYFLHSSVYKRYYQRITNNLNLLQQLYKLLLPCITAYLLGKLVTVTTGVNSGSRIPKAVQSNILSSLVTSCISR